MNAECQEQIKKQVNEASERGQFSVRFIWEQGSVKLNGDSKLVCALLKNLSQATATFSMHKRDFKMSLLSLHLSKGHDANSRSKLKLLKVLGILVTVILDWTHFSF